MTVRLLAEETQEAKGFYAKDGSYCKDKVAYEHFFGHLPPSRSENNLASAEESDWPIEKRKARANVAEG